MWKSFRVLLTENCNAHCPNCFNKGIRTYSEIALPDIKRICELLSQLGVQKIKIMGGEPTLHTEFASCIKLFQEHFKQIVIFTNAINNNICLVKPREEDIIDYNFNFISLKSNPEKFLLDKPGYRAFEIQISSKANIQFIINKLTYLISLFDGRRIHLFLTCDCTSNIFDDRGNIISKWMKLLQFIYDQPLLEWHLDHMLPKCFIPEELAGMPQLTSKKCSIECAGLIDAKLNVLFCNQFHDYICTLDEFGLMDTDQLQELFLFSLKKKTNRLPVCCSNCSSYEVDCNGGCFMHNYS